MATPATKSSTSGPPSETTSSATVQQILIDLGFSVGKAGADGIWGNDSRSAMKKAAPAAGGIYLKSERKARSVVITPKGLAVLLAGVRAIRNKKPIPSVAGTMPGWIFTKSLQLTLKNLGYLKADQVDEKFGPTTKGALERAVKDLGISYSSSRPVFNLKGVVLNPLSAYLKLVEASAKGMKRPRKEVTEPKEVEPEPEPEIKPEPKKKRKKKARKKPAPVTKLPEEKVTAKYYNRSVIRLQRILRKLGWRPRTVALDGKYSKKTADAWASSANKRNLDPRVSKISDTLARVSVSTYQRLESEAAGVVQPKKPVKRAKKPTPAPKPKPKPAGKPGIGYASKEVQTLLIELKKLPAGEDDGIWGPKSRGALKGAAISHGFKYLSSTGYSGQKMVRVNPGDLIPKLQGVLTARRKKQAIDAARKAKAEEEAKKRAAAEAEAKRRQKEAEAEAARIKKEEAEKKARRKRRRARKKEKEARLAEEKARKTKEEQDRREAERKAKEAQAAEKDATQEVDRAKKEQERAAAKQAEADVAEKQADVATQEAQEAKQEVNVTIQTGREAVQEARQQEAAGEAEKQPIVKAGMSPMILAVAGAAALGVAMMMGKKGGEGPPPAEWFEE